MESEILEDLIGEICCVTKMICSKKPGLIRYWGSDFPATSKSRIHRGQWVRVVSHDGKSLNVASLNVWLGSCNC